MSAFNEKLSAFEADITKILEKHISFINVNEMWIVMYSITNAIQQQSNVATALELQKRMEDNK